MRASCSPSSFCSCSCEWILLTCTALGKSRGFCIKVLEFLAPTQRHIQTHTHLMPYKQLFLIFRSQDKSTYIYVALYTDCFTNKQENDSVNVGEFIYYETNSILKQLYRRQQYHYSAQVSSMSNQFSSITVSMLLINVNMYT